MSQKRDENFDEDKRVIVPWLDTFKFYDSISHTLTTHKALAGTHYMQNCHGGIQRINRHLTETQEERANKLIEIMNAKNLEPTIAEN